MNFIVFDLEATCWDGALSNRVQETIEIGAIKLNDYGEVVGVFSQFIRPIINPTLSVFCKQLTSIEQEEVDRANTFPEVVEDFQDWAEIYDEDYLLCSWGNFDRKMLISDCQLHKMEHDWVMSHINLKRQYQEIKRHKAPRGLKKAIHAEGFEFTGIHHRGISDAENLAKLFHKYLDEWQF